MAARLPRRSFAAPFVIVSSLVACQKDPPREAIHANPPCCAPVDAAVAGEPAPPPVTPPPVTPPPTHTINPPPQQQPPDPVNSWSISRAHGKCLSFYDFPCGHIPPGQTPPPCNPPPQIAVACPPQLTQDGAFVKIVQQTAGADCHIGDAKVACPKL